MEENGHGGKHMPSQFRRLGGLSTPNAPSAGVTSALRGCNDSLCQRMASDVPYIAPSVSPSVH